MNTIKDRLQLRGVGIAAILAVFLTQFFPQARGQVASAETSLSSFASHLSAFSYYNTVNMRSARIGTGIPQFYSSNGSDYGGLLIPRSDLTSARFSLQNAASAVSAIPEPSSSLFFGIVAAFILMRRRARIEVKG